MKRQTGRRSNRETERKSEIYTDIHADIYEKRSFFYPERDTFSRYNGVQTGRNMAITIGE